MTYQYYQTPKGKERRKIYMREYRLKNKFSKYIKVNFSIDIDLQETILKLSKDKNLSANDIIKESIKQTYFKE